ncbi:MAG: hypothetical protein A3I79_03505 [Gemmatimonadetes bacterium RIFCSPLOWO2_02_FULL_71_11]|nr:MAG: hypothetical protein A3I79_03505 [Gemmatimonadetes bacterium RIFCSPLOWO2_02_FULL_71_11]
MRRAALLVALGLVAGAGVVRAQVQPAPPRRDSVAAVQPDSAAAVQRADSILRQQRTRGDSVRPRPPITPTGAFLRSLVLPGWGQARLGRNTTGGLFVAFEGLAAAMVWKSQWQLQFARTRNKYVESHRQEREDWIVLLVFNHLMSGAEAYVSAHLFDFPAALQIDRLPGGRAGIGVTIPLP